MSQEPVVPQLDKPEPAMFRREFIARSRPAILTGVMDDWTAMSRWTPEFFAEELGDAKLQTLVAPESKSEEGWRNIKGAQLTMRDYLQHLSESSPAKFYVAALPLRQHLPSLINDVGPLTYLDPLAPLAPRLWFGGGVEGPLHYDQSNNLHAIISGTKRFIFANPDQLSNLYPMSVFSGMPHMSRASLRDPNYERFPRLRHARSIEVTVNRGDILFIPRGWWHQVSTPVPTLSVDFPAVGGPTLDWALLRLLPSMLTSRLRQRRRSAPNPGTPTADA